MSGDWNLVREPTKKERWIAGLLAAIGFLFIGTIIFAWILFSPNEPDTFEIIFISVCFAIFLFLGNSLRRMIFGKPSKPSPKALIIFCVVWFALSIGLLLANLFGEQESSGGSIYALGVSICGSIGGMRVAWKKIKNP